MYVCVPRKMPDGCGSEQKKVSEEVDSKMVVSHDPGAGN